VSGTADAPGAVEAALGPLIEQLESTARELAAGRLDGPRAAELVERSADLAARLGADLDRHSRARPEDGTGLEAQERLL